MQSSKKIGKGQIEDFISNTTQTVLDNKIDKNSPIIPATKTKISFNGDGVIVSGTDATTLDINDSINRRYVTDNDLVKLENITGVNSGDQTSIGGITGTKLQYNTSLTDGDFLFAGDISQYTDEQAQDAVGTILVDSTEIDFVYTDLTPSITAIIKPSSIDETKLDLSVNNSLDLADTSVQPATLNNYFNKTSDDTDDIIEGAINKFTTSAQKTKIDNISITQPVDLDQIESDLLLKANLASPTFTGTVELPSTTSIGTVSDLEIGYLDGVTSPIQTQINSKFNTPSGLTINRLPKWNGNSFVNSLAFESGNTFSFGTSTNIDTFTRFYIFGGANGANLDVRPGGGGYDQSIVDLQGSDFSTTFNSVHLKYQGVGAVGTTSGFPNTNLADLSYNYIGSDRAFVIRSLGQSPIVFDVDAVQIAKFGTGGFSINALTPSTIIASDTNKNLVSLSTGTYPTLTELSYVKGVTSSIQTQLNSKQETLTNPITGTGTTNFLPKFTGTSVLGNSQIFDNANNVGIGISTPTYKLSIIGEGPMLGLTASNDRFATAIGSSNIFNVGQRLDFYVGDTGENGTPLNSSNIKMSISPNGNILINTTTDNLFDKLQVNGTVSGSPATLSNQFTTKSQTLYNNLSITANRTVTIADFVNNNELIVSVNTTSGNITVTLPNAVTMLGYKVFVKKTDVSTNSVTITGNANIDGAPTLVLSGQWSKATIISNSIQYLIQ